MFFTGDCTIIVLNDSLNELSTSVNSKSKIIFADFSTTFSASKTSSTAFAIDITKSGYTAICYSAVCGYSTSNNLVWGVEGFSSTKINGYYINSQSFNITCKFRVAYLKN